MKITIIGWYGTETIGDRAILAGLLECLNSAFPGCSFSLGSLYPVLSERTLLEDYNFLKECSSNNNLEIKLFDSQNVSQLKSNIKASDLLCVGGGPLMDIKEMYMLNFAIAFAKRNKVKTAILGCGWGPLKSGEYIRLAKELLSLSDLTILRDNVSYEQVISSTKHSQRLFSAIDPALFACQHFLSIRTDDRKSDYIAVNYRDANLGGHYLKDGSLLNFLVDLTNTVCGEFSLPIYLVPMHSFSIGGDDRLILDHVCKHVNDPSIIVEHNPLSLEQVLERYYNSAFCIGMRFHSVLMQTAVNGNNYVLDYTNPNNGKTIGLLHQINAIGFYSKGRYHSLASGTINRAPAFDFNQWERFSFPWEKIERWRNLYIDQLKNI